MKNVFTNQELDSFEGWSVENYLVALNAISTPVDTNNSIPEGTDNSSDREKRP